MLCCLRLSGRCAFLAVLLLSCAVTVQAAPQINNLSARGLQIGGTTTVAIDGTELLPDTKLFLGVTPLVFKLKDGAQPNRIEVEISLDAAQTAALAGVQQLRLGSTSGISNGVLVGVNHLPQLPPRCHNSPPRCTAI